MAYLLRGRAQGGLRGRASPGRALATAAEVRACRAKGGRRGVAARGGGRWGWGAPVKHIPDIVERLFVQSEVCGEHESGQPVAHVPPLCRSERGEQVALGPRQRLKRRRQVVAFERRVVGVAPRYGRVGGGVEGVVASVVVKVVADGGYNAAEHVDRRGREVAQCISHEEVVKAVGHVTGVLGVVVGDLVIQRLDAGGKPVNHLRREPELVAQPMPFEEGPA